MMRGQRQTFFYQHEMMWKDDIIFKKRKRDKAAERQRRLDAGEAVSDSSSVKEKKRKEKNAFLKNLKQEMTTTQAEIEMQKKQQIQEALYRQAVFLGKNLTTIRKNDEKEEKKRQTKHQRQLKNARNKADKIKEKLKKEARSMTLDARGAGGKTQMAVKHASTLPAKADVK